MKFKNFFIVSFISIFLLSFNSVKAEISQVEVQNVDIINNSISEEIKNNRYIDVSIANNFSEPIIDLAYSLTQVFAYLNDKLETRVSFMVRNIITFYSSYQLHVLIHELAGHANRCSELGYELVDIHIGFLEGSVTHYVDGCFQKMVSVGLAGVQSTKIYAEKIKNFAILENNLGLVESHCYLSTLIGQFTYIYILSPSPGHDIDNYSFCLNEIYPREEGVKFYRDITKNYGWIDLLDPMLFYSFYVIMQGKLRAIPMIRLSEEFKMLPSFSFTMNPAGYTVDLNLSVISDKKIHKIRLSIGESFFDNLITQINFVSQRLFDLKNKSLGLEIGLWYQPRICIVKDEKDKNNQDIKIAVIDESNYLGGVCFINFMINIYNRLNLELKAGYKTNGFMLEYTPLASAIFSARINYCFS